MARAARTVFLERRSYRRRRSLDAVRLIAILAGLLWLLPIAWPNETSETVAPMPMTAALFYVFGVWIAVILLAAGLAVALRNDATPEQGEGAGEATEP